APATINRMSAIDGLRRIEARSKAAGATRLKRRSFVKISYRASQPKRRQLELGLRTNELVRSPTILSSDIRSHLEAVLLDDQHHLAKLVVEIHLPLHVNPTLTRPRDLEIVRARDNFDQQVSPFHEPLSDFVVGVDYADVWLRLVVARTKI